jgi:hypothetical protein
MTIILNQSYQSTPPADPSQGLLGSYRWGALSDPASQTIDPPDPSWFIAREWQLGESQADRDIASGAVTTYASSEEFLDSL